MKILIPVDFSAASRQAMRYAYYLAEHTDAKLVLLHVFELPIVTADAYTFIPSREEINKIKENHIVHLQQFNTNDLQVKSKNVNVSYECILGNPSEEIIEYSRRENADLVIMGIQGRCVRPSYFMGSTFINIMNHSSIPLIGLHGSTNFSQLKHILFTYDLKEFNNKSVLKSITQLATYFKAHIYVLNVCEEISAYPMLSEKHCANQLDGTLNHPDISFHIIQNKDIIQGIKEFLKTHTVDLISFIPREHGILSKIFKKSTTRNGAFQIDLPFMSIHN